MGLHIYPQMRALLMRQLAILARLLLDAPCKRAAAELHHSLDWHFLSADRQDASVSARLCLVLHAGHLPLEAGAGREAVGALLVDAPHQAELHHSLVWHVLRADRQDTGVSAGRAARAAGGRSRQAAHLISPHHPGRLQVTQHVQLLRAIPVP